MNVRVMAALAVGALAMAACAADDSEPQVGTGEIEMPLGVTTPDGDVYLLSDAQLEILTIPTGDTRTVNADPSAEVLVVRDLPPGLTQTTLVPGWVLLRSQAGGPFTPVDAILASASVQTIRVVPNRAVNISFEFIVRRTVGDLRITVGVDTRPRQVSGGIRWTSGAPELVDALNVNTDTQIYYTLKPSNTFPRPLERVVEPDGAKTLVYSSLVNALDFFNNPSVALADIAASFAGGFFFQTLRVRTDGVQEWQATYFGGTGQYRLELGVLDNAVFDLDRQGFPKDEVLDPSLGYSFVASQVDTSLVTARLFDDFAGTEVLSGRVISARNYID